MRRFVRDNSLSLFFLALFVLALVGQSIAGYNVHNPEQVAHDEQTISYARFLVSSDFGANVLENWQSEWLQFWLIALATVWFFQKGSNESKKLEDAGLETDEQQRLGAHAPKGAPRWAKARDWRLTVRHLVGLLGGGASRPGSRSSSPSGRWPSLRSISASADRRSRSPGFGSADHVRPRAARRSLARFAGVRSTPGWSVERQWPSAS